jgi:hypothetical protein
VALLAARWRAFNSSVKAVTGMEKIIKKSMME